MGDEVFTWLMISGLVLSNALALGVMPSPEELLRIWNR